jgi:PDZ domain-containing protein
VSRRGRTLLVAWSCAAVALIVMLLLPVPYVVLQPTVPTDTLGADPNASSKQVLDVNDKALVHPTTGKLMLTTVGVREGRVSMGEALKLWASGDNAVVPRSVEFPQNQTQEQTDKDNVKQMVDSRSAAVVAALAEIGIPETTIGAFSRGTKADGPLKVNDQITAIAGVAVSSFASLGVEIQKHQPGDTIAVAVKRGTQELTEHISLVESPDKKGAPLLGVERVNVKISLADVSGPSAGLMFTLGIIDKLTTGTLTGGHTIAGTGTIDPYGNVGDIGGIQQKLHGAKNVGATFFFVPEGNCTEAVATQIKGLTLVKVPQTHVDDKSSPGSPTGLHAAYEDLQQIGRGGTDLPHC